jgi:hypothetical protein
LPTAQVVADGGAANRQINQAHDAVDPQAERRMTRASHSPAQQQPQGIAMPLRQLMPPICAVAMILEAALSAAFAHGPSPARSSSSSSSGSTMNSGNSNYQPPSSSFNHPSSHDGGRSCKGGGQCGVDQGGPSASGNRSTNNNRNTNTSTASRDRSTPSARLDAVMQGMVREKEQLEKELARLLSDKWILRKEKEAELRAAHRSQVPGYQAQYAEQERKYEGYRQLLDGDKLTGQQLTRAVAQMNEAWAEMQRLSVLIKGDEWIADQMARASENNESYWQFRVTVTERRLAELNGLITGTQDNLVFDLLGN